MEKKFSPKDLITKGGPTPNKLDKLFSSEEGYEIEIREENNDLYFDVIDEENKRYLSKIYLPTNVTNKDLIYSLEKKLYRVKKDFQTFEIILTFHVDGKSFEESYILIETTPTPGQEILKNEDSVFSNLYQKQFMNKKDDIETSGKLRPDSESIKNNNLNNNNTDNGFNDFNNLKNNLKKSNKLSNDNDDFLSQNNTINPTKKGLNNRNNWLDDDDNNNQINNNEINNNDDNDSFESDNNNNDNITPNINSKKKINTNLKTPTPNIEELDSALLDLKLLNQPYLNPCHRIYIISRELNQLNKLNLKKNPNLYVTKQEMEIDIRRNKEQSKYFIIALLQDILEKNGVYTVVERKCEQPELAAELLQMIVSGIGLLPVYEFHTNYSESENFKILTDESAQNNFIENWKNKLSNTLKIDKKDIFICDIKNGSLKFNAFLGKQLSDDEINNLKNQYPNEFINEGIKFGEMLLKSCKLSIEMFEPKYNNYDHWAPKGEKRGGEDYDSPLKWRGFGLKVLGKYDNGNNTWIGMKNIPGEFPVAYHGIGANSDPFPIIGNVLNQGFIEGKRQAYRDDNDIKHPGQKCGTGAYFTPIIDEADTYAGIANFNGKKYKIVFMCRVRPEKIREPNRGNQARYWILDGSKNEVRPYRILIKEYNN
jgi:hypothetical protein